MDKRGKLRELAVFGVVVVVTLWLIFKDTQAQTFSINVPPSSTAVSLTCPTGSTGSQTGPNALQCSGSAPPPTGCSGYNKTINMAWNWASPSTLYTKDYGTFGPNDIVVIKTTTGALPSTGNLIQFAGAEWQGPPTNRKASIALTPCDMTGAINPASGSPWPGSTSGPSTSTTIAFTVQNPNNYGFYPIINTNTTIYFNIINAAGSGCTGDCPMFFNLNKYGNP